MTNTKKITLTNSYHNTSVNLVPLCDSISSDMYYLTSRQIRRAREALCGISGCQCGDDVGARGHQRYQVVIEREHNGIEYVSTGIVYDTEDLNC